MSVQSQLAKGQAFRALHNGPPILVLANAWDAASARLFAEAGFPAIGTTSAGVSISLGYREPEGIPRDQMLNQVRRIVASVDVPVSADMEAGYSEAPEGVGDTIKAVIAAGAVGVNLEDSPGKGGNPLRDVNEQAERYRAAREAADSTGIPFVINARTDVFLFAVGSPESRFENAVRRSNAYLAAGADCLFVPGVIESETIAALVREIHGPVNILALAGVPPVPGPMRANLSLTRRIARELLSNGTYTAFTNDAIPYAEANRLGE
jgi:2-methylisocitrate lyase-like PEP mutase family enzyme